MKKTRILKYSTLIIIILLTILLISSTLVYSVFDPNVWKPTTDPKPAELIGKADLALGYIKVIGSVISVIALVVIGIKYIVSSVEEKAEYKKTMLPYFIGAVLLFAGSQLTSVIYNWAKGL